MVLVMHSAGDDDEVVFGNRQSWIYSLSNNVANVLLMLLPKGLAG